jgi:multiple sugar transport system ATP-binding protein
LSRIVLEGVTKQFADGTVAVNSLSLDIGDGELMVLVGPSGCGKTTVLRMVAGLEEVTDGRISIDGEIVNDVDPRHRDIAMVFQSYALYPHLSVYDNMAFSLKYRKTPKDEIRRRVNDAARILELEPYLQRKPRQLSGGQRQRVAMGRAIVRQPRAFLMDEPLSNLDAKLRVQMRAEILKIQQSLKVTTIYVTHDQTEAMTLGDRVAVVYQGDLQQVGTPRKLYRRPANRFVAAFMGSPAMNLIKARLVQSPDGSRHEVEFGSHRLALPQRTFDDNPRLAQYLGRKVVLGVRPEDLEDASLVATPDPQAIMELSVDLLEDLGSEVDVHCSGDLFQDTSDIVGEAADGGADELAQRGRAGTVVARMNRHTKLGVGDTARIHVDVKELHFFDDDSGETITQ